MWRHYAEFEYHLAATQLVFVMMGMGATLTVEDFLTVFRSPRGMIQGLMGLWVIAPAIAWGMIETGWIEPQIATGLLLISTMPGGSLSNLVTFFARGNVALSIALTTVGTLAAGVVVPLLLAILGAGRLPDEVRLPTSHVLSEVFWFLLAPVALGMGFGRLAPRYRKGFSTNCIRIGMCCFAAIFVGSLGSGRIDPWAYGWGGPLAVIVYCILSHQAAMLPGRLLGFPIRDTLAVGVEVNIRNANLALLLNASMFPASAGDVVADGVLFVILYYAAVSLVVSVPLVLVHRWRLGPERRSPAH